MRTKTILTVAAGMLCAGSALAVTSVNVVGYVNVPLLTGYNLVAPPLAAADNTIGTIIPSVPNGTFALKWDAPSQQFGNPVSFDLDIFGGWDSPGTIINGGEAIFINVSGATTVTFVGDVRQSGAGTLDTALFPAYNFIGSQVPQQGGLTTVLGYPAVNGDFCLLWDNAGQQYLNPSSYDTDIFGGWDSEPVLGLAQGAVISRSVPGTWSRNFNVQ